MSKTDKRDHKPDPTPEPPSAAVTQPALDVCATGREGSRAWRGRSPDGRVVVYGPTEADTRASLLTAAESIGASLEG